MVTLTRSFLSTIYFAALKHLDIGYFRQFNQIFIFIVEKDFFYIANSIFRSDGKIAQGFLFCSAESILMVTGDSCQCGYSPGSVFGRLATVLVAKGFQKKANQRIPMELLNSLASAGIFAGF